MHLKVVVSGQATEIVAARHRTIRLLIKDALLASHNVGRPLEAWELRTLDGRLLEQDTLLRHTGVTSGDTLYLSPHAGVGACRPDSTGARMRHGRSEM